MNRNLLLTAFDLAQIMTGLNLPHSEEHELLTAIFNEKKRYLSYELRKDEKKFRRSVAWWEDYIDNKRQFDSELDEIQKDMDEIGRKFDADRYRTNEGAIDLFFKKEWVKLFFYRHTDSKRQTISFKMRTILKNYDYKRRSAQLVEHIQECLKFYRMKATVKNVPADIAKVKLDDWITLRLK